MSLSLRRLAMLVLAVLPALAQSQPNPIDELVRQAEQSSRDNARIESEREKRFIEDRNERAALLAKAEAELAAARAQSAALKSRYDGAQKAIADLRARLQTQSGDYAQVYEAARQVSGERLGLAATSFVSAQWPQHKAVLEPLAQQRELPGVGDLEKLWLYLLKDMAENGRVSRFKAEVQGRDGALEPAEVVRVGVFSAFSDGRYLTMQDGRLVEPLRQPPRRFTGAIDDFADAQGGLLPILVDPSRGSLLTLDAARPGLLDRIEQGGEVGYLILAIGFIGIVLAAYQAAYLHRVSSAVQRQLKTLDSPQPRNPLGRVLLRLREAQAGHPNEHAIEGEILELRLSEAVLREKPRLVRFQPLIRLIVAAGPLLGLVGTVSGMIITFQVITEIGGGDPKAMARGISQAMIATLLGLGIAIPLLFVNAYLGSRSRALLQILDEQSAGMLSRALEARQRQGASHVG